ncbi:MAG: hypothetical protein GEU71_15440, partial [Actinobacteria bacterium]|nr:hypothetical protein [Actinomycetota bacterium]
MADEIEQKVLDAVERVSPDHDVIRIDPEYAATTEFCAKYGYTTEESVNCIVVVGKSDPPVYAACLVQATRRLDVNGTIRRRLGTRKASFAPSETTVELTGMLPDGVTPFGLPDDLPIWIDGPVRSLPRVIVGGGSRALKLYVPPDALAALPGAEFVVGLS